MEMSDGDQFYIDYTAGTLDKVKFIVTMSMQGEWKAALHCARVTDLPLTEDRLVCLIEAKAADAFWFFDRAPEQDDIAARFAAELRAVAADCEIADADCVMGAEGCIGGGTVRAGDGIATIIGTTNNASDADDADES